MIGVVIVAYDSADVIIECLESLMSAACDRLRIVVVDNGSPDDSVEMIRGWASGAKPFDRPAHTPLPPAPAVAKPIRLADFPAEAGPGLKLADYGDVTILRSPVNRGFAGGVNVGLAAFRAEPAFSLFWVLNPDSVVHPMTPTAYLSAADEGLFGLMGCRTIFYAPGDRIQTDGGRVRRSTGVCESVHKGLLAAETTRPEASSLDYISGANMVASRAFLDRAGPMPEDYFLYNEEVDWAFRRGDLPLRLIKEGVVYHHGGTAIGSATMARKESPFASYFSYRNTMRFQRRFNPGSVATAYAYSAAKIVRLLIRRQWAAAWAAFSGLNELPPPPAIRDRIAPAARPLAFGPMVPREEALRPRAWPT